MILCGCSFDASKSTKGASKLRRDLINSEIANLRDLLPLPSSTRQRLSQLQLMALVCVYVRKANYFHHGEYCTKELMEHPLSSLISVRFNDEQSHVREKEDREGGDSRSFEAEKELSGPGSRVPDPGSGGAPSSRSRADKVKVCV